MPHRLPFRPGPMFGGMFDPGGMLGLGGMFGAVHGQYVAPKSGGGYQHFFGGLDHGNFKVKIP